MRKKHIGIFTTRVDNHVRLCSDYVNAVHKANGVGFILPACFPEELIDEYIKSFDGFVVSGGKDVHPLFYNEAPEIKCGNFDYDVDEIHIKMIKACIKNKKPILGICRGLQLINIALNGTLYQDMSTQIENVKGHDFRYIESQVVHRVDMVKNTVLYEIFGEYALVNSMHHQCIKDLGEDLIASGYSKDGIIESIEYTKEPFIIGVQWHPEALLNKDDKMLPLFERFINEI